MENLYCANYSDSVTSFLKELSANDRTKILSGVSKMEQGAFHSVYIKTLRGPIKELIVKQYRMIFFTQGYIIYFVRVFRKKSRKTPRKEIEYAERIYKLITKVCGTSKNI